jgi:hypothetical protein
MGEKIFTVEFARTSKPADYGWSERYGEQRTIRISTTPSVSRPNLSDISDLAALVHQMRTDFDQLTRSADTQQQLASRELEVLSSKVDQRTTQLESRLQIIENRVNDLLTNKSITLGRRQVYIGIIGVILAIVASHYFDTIIRIAGQWAR